MSALLYKPITATNDNKAPAIVTSHGWFNSKEMQDLNAIEYAKRGYVVVSIDMYGHGNSDAVAPDEWLLRGTGMYDAVLLASRLPYVDILRIGVTGHSNGARAANLSVALDNTEETKLISSVFLVANDAIYIDENGEYTNIYGSRDVGIIAGEYDEFFFRSPLNDTTTAPRDYINTDNAQSFLYFSDMDNINEKRKSYKMYTKNIDGRNATRIIYTPKEIHPFNHFSKMCVKYGIEFFEKSFKAPVQISSSEQTWQYKAFFNAIGLIGFFMFIIYSTICMLELKLFSSLKATKKPIQIELKNSKEALIFILGSLLVILIGTISYNPLLFLAMGTIPKFLPQSASYYIGLWSSVCGVATFIVVIMAYFRYKKNGLFNDNNNGLIITFNNLCKTTILAIFVCISSFLIIFIADYLFIVDFRLWVVAIKAFTLDKILILLLFLPMFLGFHIINSISINCFGFIKMGNKKWINLIVLMIINILPQMILLGLQYGYFFFSGLPLFEANVIGGIWLFPMFIYLPVSVVICRTIYLRTNNPYIGGMINALIITTIICTNTLTSA